MLELKLISPKKMVFQGTFYSITVPTGGGEITILPGHAHLITTITSGRLICRNGDSENDRRSAISYDIEKGFLELKENKIKILASEVKPIQ